MAEEKESLSLRGMFSAGAETIDDAKKKQSEESKKSANYLRFNKDGKYSVRILPLAPVINADGDVIFPRKGYEYPSKEIVLGIASVDKDGKEKVNYVSVCNAKYRFPKLENDPIELYVQLVCEKYASDSKLCSTIKKSTFEGGLKYNSLRSMYVFDLDERSAGIQVLQLSYPQYKEIEERKLSTWEKLLKKNPNTTCPISSIEDAYPLEVTRVTENKKTTYSFNVDTLGDQDTLSDDELQKLLDIPRLPEILYRYSRFHMEAVIEFLKQYDEAKGIDIMDSQEMKDCFEQIRLLLPADDQSHYRANSNEDGEESNGNDLDSLWATYDNLEAAGLDDKTEEGQELRASIKEFIEENDIDIRIGRHDSNLQLLERIEDYLADNSGKDTGPKDEKKPEEKEPEKGKSEDEDENDGDDEPKSPGRRERNDDTNEPATRPERRSARPMRRKG